MEGPRGDGGPLAALHMERHAMDRLGPMPVGAVATADVLAVLEPVWATLHEAPRLRQRIGLAMQWAVARGTAPTTPPANR